MREKLKTFTRCIGAAVLAALLSLFFFSPRLLVFTEEAPGSYEWTRGLSFVDQLSGKSITEKDPALQHRLLPVYAARALGLKGYNAFVIGWVGAIALLAYVYALMQRFGGSWRIALSTTILVSTTGVVITSFGWLGIFDSWWVLSLMAISFSRPWWTLGIVALLATWIDERFLIGLPAAFTVRWLVYPWRLREGLGAAAVLLVAVSPYLLWRAYSWLVLPDDASTAFVSAQFLVWLRMAPHGWWMSYRLAWIPMLLPFVLSNASGVRPWQLAAVCLLAVSAAVVTASDITRSAMVLAPLVPGGVILALRHYPKETNLILPWLAGANLFVPYIHMVYNKTEPVHPLIWEIVRLVKKVG